MCLHCLKILREMVINLSACDTVLVELVNLRNRTGGERRRKTLRDKRDVILLEQTFRQTSPFFLKTGMVVIRPENLMLSDDHDKTRK